MDYSKIISHLKEVFAENILEVVEFRNETTVIVKREKCKDILHECYKKLGMDYLVDISSIDHIDKALRWELVYELYSMKDKGYLRIKYSFKECEKAQSVSDIWGTACWHEREIYDMMGIEFDGLEDHRRILMWEGYPYFPLRKDFPLAGKPTNLKDIAFTDTAPLKGGPFVTSATSENTEFREPRSKEI